MSGGTPVPAEAADLLSALQRSISQACSTPQNGLAVHFTEIRTGDSPACNVNSSSGVDGRLRIAQAAVQLEASAIGSLPPAPPTLRAQAGQILVRLVNRLFWWQTAVLHRFANALSELARAEVDEHALHRHAIGVMEERLQTLEEGLQDLQRQYRQCDSPAPEPPTATLRTIRFTKPIESLPLGQLISMIDQEFCVLKPGGILTVETSDAQDTVLGKALRSLMEVRGFQNVQRGAGGAITGERP
jgi:hypothetical protein